MRKPLTSNQKFHVRIMVFLMGTAGVIGGIIWLCIIWSGQVTSMQHYCSGNVGFTITDTNGDGQQITVNYNDPKCN